VEKAKQNTRLCNNNHRELSFFHQLFDELPPQNDLTMTMSKLQTNFEQTLKGN
jgi:hypothetical protein